MNCGYEDSLILLLNLCSECANLYQKDLTTETPHRSLGHARSPELSIQGARSILAPFGLVESLEDVDEVEGILREAAAAV